MESVMKYIFRTIAAFFLIAGTLSCDDRMPQYKEIPVEDVILDESIADGVEIELGDKLDLVTLVSISPLDAQNRAEFFASSDASVAYVSEMGVIEGLKLGTATITVTVAGIEKSFDVTVVPVRIAPVSSLTVLSDKVVVWKGESFDIMNNISVTPQESIKDVTFSIETSPVATLDGSMVTAEQKGEVCVTVSTLSNPELKETVTIQVPSGDLSRAGWSVTASQDVSKWNSTAEKNYITSMIDGDLSTNFCLVRPGKSYASIKNDGNEVWFYVDLGASTEVNYFRITWRYEGDGYFCRVYMFDKISGSNDASSWETIATNVYTGAEEAAQNSARLLMKRTNYRYYRFDYASETSYTNPVTGEIKGNSSQINELFLGLNEYDDLEIVPVSSFSFASSLKPGVSMHTGEQLDMNGKWTITPDNSSIRTVEFASTNPTVATVSPLGVVTALSVGTTEISGSIEGKTDSFTVTVVNTDYSRAGWSVVASLDISGWTSTAEKNSLTSAIDGDLTTNFCLVRPGKSISGVSNTSEELWFYLDLGEAKAVDYFRLVWRFDNKELFCRVYMFDEILGSNDLTTWTSIATNVYTNAEIGAQNSPLISLPKSTYRYYKFDYHSVTSYTNPSTGEVKGSSSQINEIYLGLKN